jgi:hypothetical protein
MTWPAQSSDLNIIEILWLRIKRSLQNAAGNINTPQELFLPFRMTKAFILPSTLHKVPTPYHVIHPQIITDTFL